MTAVVLSGCLTHFNDRNATDAAGWYPGVVPGRTRQVSIQGHGLESKNTDCTAILARAVILQGALKAGIADFDTSDCTWSNWESLGHKVVMKHLVSDDAALPGMARPDEAARLLVQHMFGVARNTPGVHVFVTHDSLITVTVARLQGRYLEERDWPLYLEGACFWTSHNGIHTASPHLARCSCNLFLTDWLPA